MRSFENGHMTFNKNCLVIHITDFRALYGLREKEEFKCDTEGYTEAD